MATFALFESDFESTAALRKFPCSIGLLDFWLRIVAVIALLSENVRQQVSCEAYHCLPQGTVDSVSPYQPSR